MIVDDYDAIACRVRELRKEEPTIEADFQEWHGAGGFLLRYKSAETYLDFEARRARRRTAMFTISNARL